jgi:hypothetical protein
MAARRHGRAAALAVAVALAAVATAEAATMMGAAAGAATSAPRGGRRALLGERNHSYQKGEEVKLYANKVGPFHNPR